MTTSVQIPPQVVDALKRGDLMGAIKFLREHHPDMGLKEIKALVEALQKQGVAAAAAAGAAKARAAAAKVHQSHHSTPHGPHPNPAIPARPSHLSPGEEPRTSTGEFFAAVIVSIVFVIGTLAYFFR